MDKTFMAGGTEYTLRLTSRYAIELEKAIGKHPLAMLMDLQEAALPSTKDICTMLYYGLKKHQPQLKVDGVYDIYDSLVDDEGYGYTEILALVVDVLQSGGFIPEGLDETEDAKNV